MKGFCNDDERRIQYQSNEQVGDVDIENIIGAKVYVRGGSGQNAWHWNDHKRAIFTVSWVGFRISIDGKCFTLVELEEIKDRSFTLKDLEFIQLYEQDS